MARFLSRPFLKLWNCFLSPLLAREILLLWPETLAGPVSRETRVRATAVFLRRGLGVWKKPCGQGPGPRAWVKLSQCPCPSCDGIVGSGLQSSKGIQAGTSEPGLEGDRTVFVGTSKQNIMIPELSYDPQFKTLRTF